MALPTEVQVFLVDDKGEVGIATVRIPENTSIEDARCYALALADIIDDITGSYVYSVKITYSVDLAYPPLKYPADSNSDSEAGALFVFDADDGQKTQTRIPAFREDFLVPQSRQVDLSHPEVTDFINAVVDGLCDFVVAAVSQGGGDVTGLSSARENFARSRQGRSG